jgi:type IV pilus assembly protein PilB
MTQKRLEKMGEILIAQGLITEEQFLQAKKDCVSTGETFAATLVKLGFISWDGLSNILGEQIQVIQKKRIGEVLIDQGLVTEEQLQVGLEEQKKNGEKIGKCLVDLGFISENKLIDSLSAQLDIPHVMLDNYTFSSKLLGIITGEIAREYRVMPLFENDGVVTMAMADPTSKRIKDHLSIKTGKAIEPVIASEKSILAAIDRNYAPSTVSDDETFRESSVGGGIFVVSKVDIGKKPDVKEDTHKPEFINIIISEAITKEATAIHIEPKEEWCQLRYRIDGELLEQKSIQADEFNLLVSQLKSLTGIRSSNESIPLQGQFQFPYKERQIDIQVSLFPIITQDKKINKKVVLQIIDRETVTLSFDQLGFFPSTQKLLKELIQVPDGVILVTGPQTSGKISTLYTALKYLNNFYSDKKNIMTIEKNIKSDIEGVFQSQINPDNGFDFTSGISSILQQDPDIVMVSDAGDSETVRMIIMAALAGHLVFSTLQVGDCAGAYTYLLDSGVEPYYIATTVKGILAQRLVNKICEHCKEEYKAEPSLIQKIGFKSGIKLFRGKGCNYCNSTGFYGQTGIFELLIPDKSLLAVLQNQPSYEDITKYCRKKEGFETLWLDGLRKALSGVTTIEQVLGVL